MASTIKCVLLPALFLICQAEYYDSSEYSQEEYEYLNHDEMANDNYHWDLASPKRTSEACQDPIQGVCYYDDHMKRDEWVLRNPCNTSGSTMRLFHENPGSVEGGASCHCAECTGVDMPEKFAGRSMTLDSCRRLRSISIDNDYD